MKYIIYFLAIFLLLVIQQGILMPLGIMPVNLLLVFAVTAMLIADFNTALGITLACGVLLDLASGTADGLITMSLVSALLILYFLLNSWVSREANRLVLFSAVAGTTVLYFFLFMVFNRIFAVFNLGQNLQLNYFFLRILPLSLLFNLIFTYPIFLYFSYVRSIQN